MSCHVSTTCTGPFLPRNDLFCSGSSSNYFKLILLKLFSTFKIFFFLKNPAFEVNQTPIDSKKNVKFQLSRNLTKFVWVTRFCEMNLTVRSVSSSEI